MLWEAEELSVALPAVSTLHETIGYQMSKSTHEAPHRAEQLAVVVPDVSGQAVTWLHARCKYTRLMTLL